MESALRKRYLEALIEKMAFDHGKMAFVSGPRQVGKTSLAKQWIKIKGGLYYNWDDPVFRRIWTKDPKQLLTTKLRGNEILALDEIHKAKNWKGRLKGLYDTLEKTQPILVTGSARLDVFRKGSDSLLGRYFLFHLHPFSIGELSAVYRPISPSQLVDNLFSKKQLSTTIDSKKNYEELMRFGGFPEPFLKKDVAFSNLWRRGRIEKIVREDLRDLSRIPELSQIEMLASLLPEKVGSPLSVQSLREDLEVAHDTTSRWLKYLEQLYYFFSLPTYTKKLNRSIKKERKIYLYDWSEVDDPGARFENFIASHLKKACDFWNDSGAGQCGLYYLRNKQKKEVDFLISNNRIPIITIEAKLSSRTTDLSFLSFNKHLGVKHHIQLLGEENVWEFTEIQGIKVLTASVQTLLAMFP